MKLLPMNLPDPDEMQRDGARQLHGLYAAYVEAGFDKRQAMDIILEIVRAGASAPPKRTS